jgi:hypothetical protein
MTMITISTTMKIYKHSNNSNGYTSYINQLIKLLFVVCHTSAYASSLCTIGNGLSWTGHRQYFQYHKQHYCGQAIFSEFFVVIFRGKDVGIVRGSHRCTQYIFSCSVQICSENIFCRPFRPEPREVTVLRIQSSTVGAWLQKYQRIVLESPVAHQ